MQPSTHLALGLPFPGDVGDTLPKRRGKLFDGDMGGVKGGDDLTVTIPPTWRKGGRFQPREILKKSWVTFLFEHFCLSFYHLSTSANITYTIIYPYIYFKDLLKLMNSAIVSFFPFISRGFFPWGADDPSVNREKKTHEQ